VKVEKQNVTVALPKSLVRKAKIAAAQQDTSISAILTRMLEDFVRHEDDYERAKREAIAAMRKGYDLGTHGKRTWTRDELHDRRR
jgi:hypothetical protein